MFHLMMSSPSIADMRSIELMFGEGDELLLLQDAVYGALAGSLYFRNIIDGPCSGLYVLKNDLQARGVLPYVHPKFEIIDYQYFVEMTVKHTKQITW